MNYIGVNDKLLSRFCFEKSNICVWAPIAVISPFNSTDSYIFDCSFYLSVKKEYSKLPDTRLLLSFRNPVSFQDIWFTNKMNYAALPMLSPCDKDSIEEYIKDILYRLQEEITGVQRSLKASSKKSPLLFKSTKSEHLMTQGRYYGLKVKESIIKDILCRMGYNGSHLRADIRNLHALFSINLSKREFNALICNKAVKLPVYKTVIDVSAVLARI